MYNDSPYAVPRGSFLTPVQVPTVDPDAAPTVSVCINASWIPYIIGSLTQLLLQATWDTNDPATLALAQQRAINLIFMFAGNCKFGAAPGDAGADEGVEQMIRQNPDNGCQLQSSIDGVTWCTFADFSKCVPSSATGGNEPIPPAGGGTQDYCKTFTPNNVLLIPPLVNTGDIITLESVDGSGYDGSGTEWYCPDGSQLFVTCQAGTGHTVGTDPLPATNHMQLIVRIGASFYPIAIGTPVTVPGGVTNQQAWIQVNDSTLSDNFGSYNLCYRVQNNQPSSASWTQDFDFAVTSGGFVPQIRSGQNAASWLSGTGWQPNAAYNIGVNAFQFIALHACTIVSVQTKFLYDPSGGGADVNFNAHSQVIAPSGSPQTFTFTVSEVVTAGNPIAMELNETGGGTNHLYFLTATFIGTGVNPFV